MLRVDVKPSLLRWAVERSRLPQADLERRFPKLDEWKRGQVKPTLKQLEEFAKGTHTPFGYFFLPDPPDEKLPIPDFRTHDGKGVDRPSPDLLETIYLCQQRQDWYRQYLRLQNAEPPGIVGRFRVGDDIVATAKALREALELDLESQEGAATTGEARNPFVEALDARGILVMISGIVGANTHRALDPKEFRGFAIADRLAPLIFVNGADTLSGQMFTLAHELAHLAIGQSGVSDATPISRNTAKTEQWCNAVAAEFLVPLEVFKERLRWHVEIGTEMKRLAAAFKVGTLVILRRMRDAARVAAKEFERLYGEEVARLRAIVRRQREQRSGGDYYSSARYRLGPNFAGAVIASAMEGRSTFTEAFRLLGCKSLSTLRSLGEHLGIPTGVGDS